MELSGGGESLEGPSSRGSNKVNFPPEVGLERRSTAAAVMTAAYHRGRGRSMSAWSDISRSSIRFEERSSINPFESDEEGPSTSKNKKVKPRTHKKPTQALKPKKKPIFESVVESDSESETEAGPPAIKKKRTTVFPVSEDEETAPIRAAKFKNFLSRRVASGNTYQNHPTKQGEYYIEVRISSCRELEAITTNRWRHSLISFKTATDDKTPTWKAVTQLVSAVKQDFRNIPAVLYPPKE